MDADLPAEQNAPGSDPHEERRYRLHPLTAWTAHSQKLGSGPGEMFHDEVTVVAVRLPEGWPLVVHGAPAVVWQKLAAAGAGGCSVKELAVPWAGSPAMSAPIISDLKNLFSEWERLELVELAPGRGGPRARL